MIVICLVVWNIYDVPFSFEESSQLTNSIIFERGRYTTNLGQSYIDTLVL